MRSVATGINNLEGTVDRYGTRSVGSLGFQHPMIDQLTSCTVDGWSFRRSTSKSIWSLWHCSSNNTDTSNWRIIYYNLIVHTRNVTTTVAQFSIVHKAELRNTNSTVCKKSCNHLNTTVSPLPLPYLPSSAADVRAHSMMQADVMWNMWKHPPHDQIDCNYWSIYFTVAPAAVSNGTIYLLYQAIMKPQSSHFLP